MISHVNQMEPKARSPGKLELSQQRIKQKFSMLSRQETPNSVCECTPTRIRTTFVAGSLYQDPFGPLVSGSCSSTSLSFRTAVGPLAGSQDPVGALNMFQKHCACHEIMTRDHTKCCAGHANWSSSSSSKKCSPSQESSPSTSKHSIHGAGSMRLPTFWQHPQNTAPATIFTKCPIPCICHVNSRFDPPKPSDLLHLSRKTTFCFKTCTDTR